MKGQGGAYNNGGMKTYGKVSYLSIKTVSQVQAPENQPIFYLTVFLLRHLVGDRFY
jgi:hypothetical protein